MYVFALGEPIRWLQKFPSIWFNLDAT